MECYWCHFASSEAVPKENSSFSLSLFLLESGWSQGKKVTKKKRISSSNLQELIPCLQSFPALESSPKSWLFTSGSQSIEALASVFPVNIQGWFPLGLTGLILQSKGLWRVFSSTTIWMHYDAWVICLTFVSSHGHFIISHHHKKDENISLWYIERETIFTVFLLQYIVIIFYLNIVNPLQYLIYNLNIIIGMYV